MKPLSCHPRRFKLGRHEQRKSVRISGLNIKCFLNTYIKISSPGLKRNTYLASLWGLGALFRALYIAYPRPVWTTPSPPSLAWRNLPEAIWVLCLGTSRLEPRLGVGSSLPSYRARGGSSFSRVGLELSARAQAYWVCLSHPGGTASPAPGRCSSLLIRAS